MIEEQPQQTAQNPLRAYLEKYHLAPLDVSIVSQVRYSTIWNILHNKPIKPAHAALVRRGLQRLTGIPYREPIHLLPLEDKGETSRHA
jgi:hypothetical protein